MIAGERTAHGEYDVWLPSLAPGAALLRQARASGLEKPAVLARFFAAYERQLLATAESRGLLDLLATLAARTPISLGCFCADESRCHRTRLAALLRSRPVA